MTTHFSRSRAFLLIHTILVCAFLLAPLAALIPMSFSSSSLLRLPPPALSVRWYAAYFTDPAWMGATKNSFVLGISTAVISVVIGLMAAYGLAKWTHSSKVALQSFLLAPLMVPSIILAVALYHEFAALGIVGTFPGLLIAHTVVTVPFVVVVMTSSFERLDFKAEEAAIGLGATRFSAITRVTFPMVKTGIFVSLFFAFLNSFDEVVLSTFLSGTMFTTLPAKLWEGIRFELSPVIAAISVVLILISTVIVVGTAIARRRVGTDF